MEKEITIFELNHGHACRERHRKSNARHYQIFERAIDDADVPREWLVRVERFVKRGVLFRHHLPPLATPKVDFPGWWKLWLVDSRAGLSATKAPRKAPHSEPKPLFALFYIRSPRSSRREGLGI